MSRTAPSPPAHAKPISYAVTQSACSDTIHIHGDGGLVYDEAVTISFTCTSGTVFTLRDWAGNGTPVISSSVGDGLDISGAFIIIDGIRFDTNFANGILTSGAGVKNLTVQNSEFADNLGAAIESYGGGADDDWVIQNNAFDNNGNRAILFTGINVTIDGNTISLTQANQGILVDAAASGTFTITNNSVSGGGDPSVAGIEILSTGGGTCDVGGNRVYGNAGPGIYSRQPACTIKNNLVYNNGANGLGLEGNNVAVVNNTIYNNGDSGVILAGAYTGVTIVNNILARNLFFGISDMLNTNEPATESNNLFFLNGSGACNQLTAPKCTVIVNDILGSDPLFVDEAGGDFHLSQIAAGQGSLSPAVDAGSNTALFFGLDTLMTRTDNVADSGTVDMGFHYPSELVTNYRSIGMNTGELANVGIASVAVGSTTVAFSTALPPPNAVGAVGPGDVLTIDPGGTPEVLYIISVDSPFQVTVQWAATIDHSTGFAYFIKRAFSGVTAIQDWETARQGNLVVGDSLEVGIAYKDAPFTNGANIEGSTTDPFHFMRLTVAPGQRHDGTAGTGTLIDNGGVGGGALSPRDPYTQIAWFEITDTTADQAAIWINQTGLPITNVLLSHLLLYDNEIGIVIEGTGGNSFIALNSVIYNNASEGIAGDEATDFATVENCTLFGNGVSGVSDLGNSIFTVRNTIAMNNGANGDFDLSGGTQENNISSDASASCGATCLPNRDWTDLPVPGAPPQGNGWVIFQDLTAGAEDFHLRNNLAQNDAQQAGKDLSANFETDIDEELRVDPWDIGADETLTLPPGEYRSVGVNAGDLNTFPRTVAISGTTATFSGSMPPNVGVGDVLQYFDGSYHLAFIHGRISDTVYTVRDASSGTPQPAPASTPVQVYRAYISLFDWEAQNENFNLDVTVRDFDTSTDLVASGTSMNVACYADGMDTTPVVVSGWNTGVNDYIRIFTPTAPITVGISQRHNGTWDPTKYLLEGTGSTVLEVAASHVRIRGLQVSLNSDTSNASGIRFMGSTGPSAYEVSHSIIRGNGVGALDGRIGLEISGSGVGELRAWNNLLYDWAGGSSQVAGIRLDDLDFTSYLYNNTVVDNRDGIDVSQGTVIASNNLAYNNGDNYVGSFDPTGTNNLSGPGTDPDMPTTNGRDGVTVAFVNAAGGDFHLDPSDAGARDFGADLSGDVNLPFDQDIDRELRLDPWDIGADEMLAGGPMQVISGFYTGDGFDNKFILVGFQPDVVVVKEDTTGEWSVMRTATMVGDASKELASAPVPLFAGGIKSLDPSGFTLGTDSKVNASGATHYWIAFKAGAGEMRVGSYPGDGMDNRSIPGVGFRPDYVITMSEGPNMSVHRSSSMTGDTSYNFNQTELGPPADAIQAFEPDGFQVGSDPSVNAGATTYHYVAWKQTANRMAVGTYVGDGADFSVRDIVAFQPEWLLVKREGDTERWMMKPASTGPSVDYSLFVSPQPGSTDFIQALRPLGFELGISIEVNNFGSTYHWIAFAGAGGDSGQVHYRWRFDDGDEVFATWAVPEDTKLTGLPKNTVRRLRFQVFNRSGVGSGAVAYQLQVAETASCSLGTYAPVPIAATTEHWEIVDSPNIFEPEPTTDVSPGLSNEATTFIPGEVKEAGNTTIPITLNDDEYTEIEFVVQATSNATDGGDYCLRLDAGGGPPYLVYAEVSLAASPSLTLADHDVGQIPDQFATTTPITSELFVFKLTTTGTVTVSDLRVHFSNGDGVLDGDITSVSLYQDLNNDGFVDGGDFLVSGSPVISGGVLDFNGLSEAPGPTGINYLVEATVSGLVAGDTTTFSLDLSDIDEVQGGVVESGASSNAVHTQDSVSGGDVFYSVGTSRATSTDLKTDGPTITITNGTATFSVAQTGNVGVGDEISYGGSLAYIKSVLSQTLFVVHTATGGMPGNVTDVTVNSIMRAFKDVVDAESLSRDASHLTTGDLRAGFADANLTWVLYNDSAITTGASINSYTTDATHIITVTAAGASQVASGVSQRHTGTAGTGVVINTPSTFEPLSVSEEFVTVEYLEIRAQ